MRQEIIAEKNQEPPWLDRNRSWSLKVSQQLLQRTVWGNQRAAAALYYQRTSPECPWNSSKEMSGGHLRALCAIRAFIRCSVVSQYRSYKPLSVALATYGIHARRSGIHFFFICFKKKKGAEYILPSNIILSARKFSSRAHCNGESSQSRVQLKRDLSDYSVIPYLNIYVTLDNEIASLVSSFFMYMYIYTFFVVYCVRQCLPLKPTCLC